MMSEAVPTPAALGAMVRRLREQAGLRQRDLALAAGVGERFLVELEAGKPTVRLDKLLAVLEALGARLGVVPSVCADASLRDGNDTVAATATAGTPSTSPEV